MATFVNASRFDVQSAVLRPLMNRFLVQLGRNDDQKSFNTAKAEDSRDSSTDKPSEIPMKSEPLLGTDKPDTKCYYDVADANDTGHRNGCYLTFGQMRDMMANAKVYYDRDKIGNKEVFMKVDRNTKPYRWEHKADYYKAQSMAIAGPVYVLYNNTLSPQPPRGEPVTLVSVSGINLAYNRYDTIRYYKKCPQCYTNDNPTVCRFLSECPHDPEGHENLEEGDCIVNVPDEKKDLTQSNMCWDLSEYDNRQRMNVALLLDPQKVIDQAAKIWALILTVMQKQGVQYPVLNGIGCGVFRGPCDSKVFDLWAQALVLALKSKEWGFEVIFFCQPTFLSRPLYEAFANRFNELQDNMGTNVIPPIVLCDTHGAIPLADFLGREYGVRAGLLNASDAHAVRQGFLGMYFDGGDAALEEQLAVQTSMLLQHRAINPKLYDDPTRRHAVDLPPMSNTQPTTGRDSSVGPAKQTADSSSKGLQIRGTGFSSGSSVISLASDSSSRSSRNRSYTYTRMVCRRSPIRRVSSSIGIQAHIQTNPNKHTHKKNIWQHWQNHSIKLCDRREISLFFW